MYRIRHLSLHITKAPGKNLVLVTLCQRSLMNVTVKRWNSSRRECPVTPELSKCRHGVRVCISITPDRSWRSTTYPSEPFFSCATGSLREMCNLDTSLKALEDKVPSGMVGKSCELAEQLLGLLAKDLYLSTSPIGIDGQKYLDPQEW